MNTNDPPHSTFSTNQKRWIIFVTALAGLFSPLSSFIFYPAINAMSQSLDVSVGMVNLAITTYMAVSGVAPALIGTAADNLGRRPIYVLALTIYFVANIGLALQNSFAALLVLRMLQSAGSSGMTKRPGCTPCLSTCQANSQRHHLSRLWSHFGYHNPG